MQNSSDPITILVADDDPDDREMTREAFGESQLVNDLRFVKDGEELLDYLHRRGKYADPLISPRPHLLLLDLNMPKKDGRQVLAELRADPRFEDLRVIVLTTSRFEDVALRRQHPAVAACITKPMTFKGFVDVISALGDHYRQFRELKEDESSWARQ